MWAPTVAWCSTATRLASKSNSGTSIHMVQNKHPSYDVSSARIKPGATVKDIINKLRREDPDSYDFTLVVCMLSDLAGDAVSEVSEASTIGADI